MDEIERFPIPTSRLSSIMIRPLAWGTLEATLDERELNVQMGWLGRANVPLEKIESVGRMRWPWWAGVGVRLSKNLVVFAGRSGEAVLVGLSESLSVRAPLPWRTGRLAIVVSNADELVAALNARCPGATRVDDEF